MKVVAIMPETLDVSENFFIPRSLLPAGGRTETLVKLAPGATMDGQTVEEWAAARGEAQQRSNSVRTSAAGRALSSAIDGIGNLTECGGKLPICRHINDRGLSRRRTCVR